jgi:hypothetical protein
MKRRQYDDRENPDIFAAAMAVAEAHQEPQEKAEVRSAHDPEKACPGLDHKRVHARLSTRYGWIPVFGKDHAPAISWSRMTIEESSSRSSRKNQASSTFAAARPNMRRSFASFIE